MGGDAAEIARRDLPLDDVADLGLRETLLGAGEQQLVAVRRRIDDLEDRPRLDLARRRVDFDLEFARRVDALARGGEDRRLQSLDEALAADAALLFDIFEYRQQFVAHNFLLLTPDS